MAVRKRKAKAKEAGKPASSASGGIKKRTSIPVEDDTPQFSGELGKVINTITDSGDYGKPFIKASSRRMDTGRLRTGILSVDLCLGGGFTTSRASMLYGEKSSGKSTMALQTIAQLHKSDPDIVAGYVDIEGTIDKKWAAKLGCDLDRLLIAEPEGGEDAVDLADALLRAKEIGLVVTDSIAMIVSMKEVDASAEQETMALQARLVGKYVRKTANALIKERSRGHTPILLHINQFRMKVGLTFGDPRVLPGGKALEFSTTQQIEIKNKEVKGKDEDGNEVVLYNEHNAKITKNKGGGPMKEAAYKLNRLKGSEGLPEGFINQAKTIYKYGSQIGIVQGSPSSFQIDGITGSFRGAPAFNKWALENDDLYQKIQENIIKGFRKRWDL